MLIGPIANTVHTIFSNILAEPHINHSSLNPSGIINENQKRYSAHYRIVTYLQILLLPIIAILFLYLSVNYLYTSPLTFCMWFSKEEKTYFQMVMTARDLNWGGQRIKLAVLAPDDSNISLSLYRITHKGH